MMIKTQGSTLTLILLDICGQRYKCEVTRNIKQKVPPLIVIFL